MYMHLIVRLLLYKLAIAKCLPYIHSLSKRRKSFFSSLYIFLNVITSSRNLLWLSILMLSIPSPVNVCAKLANCFSEIFKSCFSSSITSFWQINCFLKMFCLCQHILVCISFYQLFQVALKYFYLLFKEINSLIQS